MLLCVGIGYGEMLRIGDADIFGAEVNAACKLGEDVAKSSEILLTGAASRETSLPPDTSLQQLDAAPAGADSALKLVY